MAKKTKLTEAELIEQNPAPEVAPTQATPEEVQAAQAAAPVADVADTPLVEEPAPVEASEPAPEPQPETISIEMQIPTDQLAAAVAQVTGDIEAAETAPDVEAEKQSEIAALETPAETGLGEITAEEQEVIKEYRKYKAKKFRETAEEAPAELNVEDEKDGEQTGAPADEPQSDYSIIQESEEEDDKEEAEEVCPECGENPCICDKEEEEEIGDIDVSGLFADDEESEEIDTSRLADIFGGEEEIEDTIDALNTSSEFLNKILSMGDDFEEVAEPEPFEDPDPMPEEEMTESLDFNKLINKARAKGFEALGGYEALEREIEEYKNHPEKYAHNPLKGLIDSLLVKRGFMDEDHNWIEPDEYEDDYEEDIFDEYEDEEEMDESINLNKIINKAKAKGFEALGGYEALEREIEEYKNHPEKYAHNPLKRLIDNLLVKRGFMDEDHNWIEPEDDYEYDEYEDDPEDFDFEDEEDMDESLNFNNLINKAKAKGFEALGGYEALEREIEEYKNHPEKYAHNPLKGLIDSLLVKRGFMDEDHNWIEPEDDEYEDDYEDDIFDEDEYDPEEEMEERKRISRRRVKENARKRQAKSRYNEAIIYPAGSKPIGSEINNAEEDNLVKAYEKTAAARRRALSNFRESMRKTSASSQDKAKFKEALSSRTSKAPAINKKSWSANRFEDKYEEKSKLNYKDLLNNGYLG